MSDLQNVERLNFYRLSLLILDIGTHALQSLFEKEYSATGDLQAFLNSKNHILNKLYRKKIIKQTQKELIQPSNGTKPVLETFDISLVSTLLSNLCPIAHPLAGWAVRPAANDQSTGADVLRLRTARNELFAHRTKGSMDTTIFEKEWIEIDKSIMRLSNQLDLKKQEQIRDRIENVKIAHINWERETQINGQLFDNRLCDILQKLEEIIPMRLEVISSDGVEDAMNAEIPEGPDGIICVLKEYPKLKSELTKDSVEAITKFMLESKLINRANYEKIKDSSCKRTVFIDMLLKMVVQGKPELLECFFSELKMECPHLAIALSKMEVTQEDRDKYHLVEDNIETCSICRIKLNNGIDESDISFFQNHQYDYPEVIDDINDKLLSQFLISLCEHSKVSYSQDPDKKICALFETMQRHHLPVESVLKDALQPTLFKRWENFRINKLHQKVLQICLPVFERKLNFEMVFTLMCQANLFDNSSSSKLTKQATKSDKTKMLLCFLQERDRLVYEKFKECLILSKQYMLKKVLEEEELKLSQGMKTEDTTGNECYWRVLLQWISTAATSVLANFSRHFRMRFISGENGSIILKFVALKDFKVELLNQSDVQKHLEKLLRNGCLDSKIKVDGPVYVTVYILSPGDEGMEEYIHFHLDFEAFHAKKESKAQLESHEINLLVEELNPSQLHCWTFDQPQIGMDSKEKMEAILSQRGLSRREKMELLLDIIIRLENGHGTLEKFCEENDKYVYDKVFRKSKQMDPKNTLSYQKGGGRQKLYSMWINIDEEEDKGFSEEDLGTVKGFSEEDLGAFKGFTEEDLGAVKGFSEEDLGAVKGKPIDVHVEEIMKKGSLADDEERAWKRKNYEAENKYEESPGMKLDAPFYREARRLCELFHGRFSQEEAFRLYTFCNRNLQEAVNFVFHGEPKDIRNIIGEGEGEYLNVRKLLNETNNSDEKWKIVAARNNRDINQVLKNEIQDTVRQFGCESCDKVWWRRVPVRKLVSQCKSCKKKFDAIPREDEWGRAKYICSKCTKEFIGFGAMGRTKSPCYGCTNLCMPVKILPPYNKKPVRKSSNVHSCTAQNCYNRIPHASSDMINLCVHPKSMMKSLGRKVLNPSHHHVSTGSTVKTFLNQDDLESLYEPTLDDISEELDDGSDDSDDNQ